MKSEVMDFVAFGEVEDRVEFLEQLTMHIKECSFDDSDNQLARKTSSLINLISPRRLELESMLDEDRKKPSGKRILLMEFILPGILNKTA